MQPFQRKQFWMLLGCMVVVAFGETITLGAIAFFASAVTDPLNVLSSKYVLFIKKFMEIGALNSIKGLIVISGTFMCTLLMLKNSLKTFAGYFTMRFSTAMETYFGKILLDGFLCMPYQWHLSRNSADLINAVNWRTYLGRNFFRPSLNIFNDLLMIFVMLTALLIIQPAVSFIVILVLGGASFFIYKVIKKRIDKISILARDYQIAINKEISMSIQGIKDVKISGNQDIFISKYLDNAIPFSKIAGYQGVYSNAPPLILETSGFLMLFISICIMLISFDITTAYVTGTMALLAVTAWKVLPAVSQILSSMSNIRNSLPYIQSLIIYILLIEENYANWGRKHNSPISFIDRVAFRNVCFSYQADGSQIIQNFNFEIRKGETVGIIGASGAGKSTLVDLLIGLLRPFKGEINIDQQNLSSKNIKSWLQMIGYVPQFPYIYDETLEQNIAFGEEKEKIDRSWVKQCCTMASMDNFIHDLPEDIDSYIGERGVKLSGGQKQRVAIARALYRKPQIMIFDEATSSLDSKSEKSIQKTIYSFKGKQTLIIIAHRLSSVEKCDKIIWVEHGKIRKIGKPSEVLPNYNVV